MVTNGNFYPPKYTQSKDIYWDRNGVCATVLHDESTKKRTENTKQKTQWNVLFIWGQSITRCVLFGRTSAMAKRRKLRLPDLLFT